MIPKGKYEYDALYRLVQASGREKDGLAAPNQTGYTPDFVATNAKTSPTLSAYCEKYTYDELGNILALSHKDTCDGTENWKRTYVYNSGKPNNYLQNAYTGSTAPGSAEFTYDAHGNIQKMSHLTAMNWDFQDQLKSTVKTDKTTYYVYAGGERVRKVVVDTSGATDKIKYERIYLGGYELYREHDSSEELELERTTNHINDDTGRIAMLEVKTRANGSDILSVNQTTITRYQYNNHLGSACLELNENAEVLSYEEFHPFGSTSYSMHSNDSEVSLKRYKYNGKERDNESGLDFYGARYYANWLCRFVSVDPLKDNYPFQNSFAYAANSPITLTDVNGEGPGGGEDEEEIQKEEFENKSSNSDKEKKGTVLLVDKETGLPTVYIPEVTISAEFDNIEELQYSVTVTDANGGRVTDMPPNNEISDFNKALANFLRYSPILGVNIENPFQGAEAIIFDVGVSLTGAERDKGKYFILAGPEAGKWGSFDELAGGVAPELGVGGEVGRVDISGNENEFTSEMLFGYREKVWGSVSPTGELTSIGGAYAFGIYKDKVTKKVREINIKSVQFGFSLSAIPFISGGYNEGEVY